MRVTFCALIFLAALFTVLVSAGPVLDDHYSGGLQLSSRNNSDDGKSSTTSDWRRSSLTCEKSRLTLPAMILL